ncbi:MAG TPA: patatin-like phospholipase family protein [Kineosporiaceae bacterium]|nr:patatin-like phospholipase family protein [Kineosporiaceae bacterium]
MNRRWALVLGGGGVLGGAWMVGALSALEQVHGLDARDAEVIVGTSAGALVAAMLGAGVSVDELRAHQLGDLPNAGRLGALDWNYDTATGGSRPSLQPRMPLPGSAGLVTRNASRLRRLPPTAVLAALVPAGRGSLEAVGRLVGGLVPHGWAPHPGVRVVAMDFESGHRTAFGAPDAPAAALPEAVMASCAIPGWYAPVTIGGRRYVDGGACSSTNVDLVAGLGLDEVFVLAPMVSFSVDNPRQWRVRAERHWRLRVTRRCMREVAKVHGLGTDVTVLGPGAEDLDMMGSNLMSVERRTHVLQTALVTSTRALADPEPLLHLPRPVRSEPVLPDLRDDPFRTDRASAGEVDLRSADDRPAPGPARLDEAG